MIFLLHFTLLRNRRAIFGTKEIESGRNGRAVPNHNTGVSAKKILSGIQRLWSFNFYSNNMTIVCRDIKERDSITRRIKYRWSTNSVLSCVLGRGQAHTIDFIFDTTRKDRQNRTYFVEQEDATVSFV